MRVSFLLPFFALVAYASLSGGRDQHYVCPYDTVWEAITETMKGYSVMSENKGNGTIETAWIEMEGKTRPFGIFGREGFGNRERARLTVAVKNTDNVSLVSVLETRQRWHARGSVSQQAMKWWPIEPSEEVLEEVTGKLNARLKEKGCETARDAVAEM
ncbi:MAG: hypothetical protein K2X00_19160 [Nitrospiraceae bacterium]|nr:hypothetical protein [Nitrospiraceae bacterium]